MSKSCPPCIGNCNQGRICPAQEARAAEALGSMRVIAYVFWGVVLLLCLLLGWHLSLRLTA